MEQVNQVTNPMKVDAMEFLYNTGRDVAQRAVSVSQVKIGDDIYADIKQRGSFEVIRPADPIPPKCTEFFTLQGLVDFIRADVDGVFKDPETRHIVRVVDQDRVEIVTPITGTANTRYVRAFATAKAPAIRFDEYQPCEDATVMILTRFIETDNRAKVLSLIGNIVADQSITTQDDGFSQRLTVKQGVAGVGYTSFQNPVYLKPRRTFAEVEQPETPFVVRFKHSETKDGDKVSGKNTVAIFEADGGAWKIGAVKNVLGWLREQLAGANVEVIG